jgi:hypothetical protein
MYGESLLSSSRKILGSSIIGIVGAILAVVSIYAVWFEFSGYALTGIQLDESLREGFSYSLFVSVVYLCPILVVTGVVFTKVKPYEQLIVRSFNAFLLFVAMMVASIPLLRMFGSQPFSVDSFEYLQYGFWVLVVSVGLLCCSWLMSLSEIRKIRGKFELVRDQIRSFLHEVESETEILVFVKKCGVNEKSLMEVWGRCKDKEFKDFFVSDGKIVNKRWLRKKLEERLM